MAYSPIARTLPQYVDSNGTPYSGAVLKAYAEGTSTNISFATNSTGATTISSIALNASGYPEVSGAEVIPHINQNFKLALYPTQAAADSDSGDIWTIDNIKLASLDGAGNEVTQVGNATARTSAVNAAQVQDSTLISLGTTSGSVNQYELSPSIAITAYAATQFFIVNFHIVNTSATPYLQINSIANPATNAVIKKLNGSKAEIAVEAGDLLGLHLIKRNEANDAWIVLNPRIEQKLTTNKLNLPAAVQTISGGSITYTQENTRLNGEGNVDDDLGVIAGGSNGDIITIRPNGNGVITLVDSSSGGSNNIDLIGNTRRILRYEDSDSVTLECNGSSWLERNANLDSVSLGYAIFRDEKSNGTDGGSISAGVNTRVLNTTSYNNIYGCSLGSNQVTLPLGIYKIIASAPAVNTNSHRIYLYNATDGAVIPESEGSSEYSASNAQTRSFTSVVVAFADTKVIEIRHWSSASIATNGLGVATSSGIGNEVYAEILIQRLV